MAARMYQKGLESAAVLTLWYDRAYRDNRKFTVEDIDETALSAGALAWIWWAEMPPAAAILPPATAAIGVGAVTSYAIAGEKGYYDYVDFITDVTSLDVVGVTDKVLFTGETLGGAAVNVVEKKASKAGAGLSVLATTAGNVLGRTLDKIFRRTLPGFRLRPFRF